MAIDHGADEYSILAHLRVKTVAVGLNERVRQDQYLGRIGFSGDTGLQYRLVGSGRRVVKDGLLHTGQFIER